MRWFRLIFLMLVFALLAVRFPPGLVARGVTPFWLLLPAILFAFVSRPGTAALAGWCFGAVVGLLSVEPFGVSAFLYAAAAWLISTVRGSFFSDHPVTQGVTAFVFAFLVGVLELLRIEVAAPALAFWPAFSNLLLMALLTGVAFPMLFAVESRLGFLKGFKEGESHVRA
jgi:rod shape-determining protein MreD